MSEWRGGRQISSIDLRELGSFRSQQNQQNLCAAYATARSLGLGPRKIENTLAKHPGVSIAAVVAKPDEKWGEVPCAFIEKVKYKQVTENELISICKETLANFKVPKKVEFCELPKTSTGKIQKFELRKKAKEI
mgnify:CR=1 FL=1